MSKRICDILVLGKTGVGKSSFINYIYGDNLREQGTGTPKTKPGVFKEEFLLDDLLINIFDSWGLEADKEDEWTEIIDILFENSSFVNSSYNIDKPNKDYFHSIFYCISAKGARIEDLELKIIKNLISKNNEVTIILTKCDIARKEEIEKIKEILKQEINEEFKIICVSNEEKKLLTGKVIKKFGREEIIEVIFENLLKTLIYRAPKELVKLIVEEIDEWRNKELIDIDSIGVFSKLKEEKEYVEWRSKKFLEEELKVIVDKSTEQVLKEYKELLQKIMHGFFSEGKTNINLNFDMENFAAALLAIESIALVVGEGIISTAIMSSLITVVGVELAALFGPLGIIGLRVFTVGKTKEKLKDFIDNFTISIKNKVFSLEDVIRDELKKGLPLEKKRAC